jgi:steroid 5-alpha reductase family enzyme
MESKTKTTLILFLALFVSNGLESDCFHQTPISSSISSTPRHPFSSKRISSKTTRTGAPNSSRTSATNLQMGLSSALIGALRGGASSASVLVGPIVTALQGGGPLGVAALTLVASAVVTPLTLYRQAYSFSVGYGFSVFAMGIALLSVFWKKSLIHAALTTSKYATSGAAPIFLVASIIFYGFRLGSFLLLRELTVPSKQKQIKSFDKTPLLKRVPFSISVAMFYAFMVTPVMYACRQFVNTGTPLPKGANQIAFLGAAIAWFGALMEAIADGHKFLVKRGKDESVDFHGPTTGVYAMSRHPNYIAEIVYWFGVLLCGIPSFGKSPIAWICSSLGFVGIYKIMIGATDRLDAKQEEKVRKHV